MNMPQIQQSSSQQQDPLQPQQAQQVVFTSIYKANDPFCILFTITHCEFIWNNFLVTRGLTF